MCVSTELGFSVPMKSTPLMDAETLILVGLNVCGDRFGITISYVDAFNADSGIVDDSAVDVIRLGCGVFFGAGEEKE